MSVYKGTIIEESLRDKTILQRVTVIGTEIEQVTENFQTPWLSQWTLRTVEIENDYAEAFAQALSQAIETEHPNWFADFNDETTHYIVFPGKVFIVDRAKPDGYAAPRAYGLTRGIPGHQLDFPATTV